MMRKIFLVAISIILLALFANAFYNANNLDGYVEYNNPNRPYVAGSP